MIRKISVDQNSKGGHFDRRDLVNSRGSGESGNTEGMQEEKGASVQGREEDKPGKRQGRVSRSSGATPRHSWD